MKNLKVEEVGFVAVALDADGNFVEGLCRGTDYLFDSSNDPTELFVMDNERDFDSVKEIFAESFYSKLQILKVKKFVNLELVK